MHSIYTAITLWSAIVSTGLALPRPDGKIGVSGVPNVGYGQQLQDGDQANHWVVWVEGENACPPSVVIDPLTDSPCNIDFELPGYDGLLHLGDCDKNNKPHSLFTETDFVTSCTLHDSTIHCSGSTHNVIKHGKCKH
ncbi:hypothetical protein F5B22DRAFT_575053 [Xylaria bambusicola]|uniref:uncharacterized protein n=1 Tax=Xylaria bambusicola TaxID=326684 RepID=UPI0020080FAA|nr:uncharacterized protein F5B22DRAFT_575053 [Xylaria bambusicola]KAI0503073.1 hypothetical protein F5B22DRAFT_575053 [Xylaria bambusicola]